MKEKYKEVVIMTFLYDNDSDMWLYDYYENVYVEVKDKYISVSDDNDTIIEYPKCDIRGVMGR